MDMKASLKALGWIFLGMRGPLGMPLLVCPFVRPPEKFNWHKGVGDRDAAAFKNKYGRNSKARDYVESDGRTWLEDC